MNHGETIGMEKDAVKLKAGKKEEDRKLQFFQWTKYCHCRKGIRLSEGRKNGAGGKKPLKR